MSISSAMYTGLSGLSANGEAMGVLGDNISNLNTTGFKYSQVAFEDLMAQTVSTGSGPGQEGRGTRISQITPIFSQGSMETSADDVDVGISGTGFFIVKEPTTSAGKLYYSRDGNFSLNKDGYLVNTHGYRVQGYQMVDGAPSGTFTDIVISQNYSPPAPTANMEMVLNLDSKTEVGPDGYYESALSIYDALGTSHTINMKFTKTADNTWAVSARLDGTTDITVYNYGTTTAASPMTFTNGIMDAGLGDFDLVLDDPIIPGGNRTRLLMNGTNGGSTTQFDMASVTNYASQDGYPSGYLQRVSINNEGIITGNYSNGQITPLYQLTLARFNAPTKLHREGSNMYTETQDSGVPLTGTPLTNGLGSIAANSLEQSNVDLGDQFVHMILYQRAFQANSRVITTSDTLLEEVLSLKR